MVQLTIDGQETQVPEDSTVLKAAQGLGIRIPTLCFNAHLKPYGGCRICLVEIAGPRGGPGRLVASCAYPVEQGLVVTTNSDRVKEARKFVCELLLAGCDSDRSPELQQLARDLGVPLDNPEQLDTVGKFLLTRAPRIEKTRCIKCGLCVRVCDEFVGMSATGFAGRGSERRVKTPFDRISQTCIGCGACAYLCPTKAIRIEPAEE